jgi:DNA-binding NarL/FixJ family response regulator
MESCVWAMLVAGPGPLRDSLRAPLSAIPFTNAFVVDDAAAALEHLERCQPALAVVDFDPTDAETWRLLRALIAHRPPVRHVFLVDTVEEQRIARAAGVNVALLKGFSAPRLQRLIEGLLPKSPEERRLYQTAPLQADIGTSDMAASG